MSERAGAKHSVKPKSGIHVDMDSAIGHNCLLVLLRLCNFNLTITPNRAMIKVTPLRLH